MTSSRHVQELFDLKGQRFLVVGGARGLGYEFALALAEAGADGAITSHSEGSALDAAERLQAQCDREIAGFTLDATNEPQVKATVAALRKQLGRIDILINNVGGGGTARAQERSGLDDRELEDWERVQRLNVTAPWLMSKHVAPVMRAIGGGSIINIASIAGLIGRDRSVYPHEMVPQSPDYAAAKGAIIALTRDLAALLGKDGIRVNAISPGGIQGSQPQAFVDAYCRKTMLGRMGRGEDLKAAVVFLASAAGAYVTGHNLVIDGGFSNWQ